MRRVRFWWCWTSFVLLVLSIAWFQRQPLLDVITIALGREEQSHVLLAPLLIAWLVWLRRSRFAAIQIRPNWCGPVVLAAGFAIGYIGLANDLMLLWHAGPIIGVFGAVISAFGFGPIKQFGPAALATLALLPVPGSIRQAMAVPLQAVAIDVTRTILELAAVPVVSDGHILVINGERVAVGEACNGMRMVMALGLTAYAFAFSAPLRHSVRIMLLIASPVVAVLCNVLRLIPTSLIYGYSSTGRAEAFHDVSGWVMLPIALLMLFGIVRFLRWVDLPVMSFRLAMR